MLIPLPSELEALLEELADYQGVVDDCNYTGDERTAMKKLQQLGLVQLSWRLTADGKSRLLYKE